MITSLRRLVRISPMLVTTLLFTAPVGAQTMDHGNGHGGMTHDQGGSPYAEAMDEMMQSMETVAETGDPDADFLLLMIPHHQSAVEMARTLLDRSDDAEVTALAQAVIDTQEAEIGIMKAMLARLGHPVE